MERLEITGGKSLVGEVSVSGAKNEALKVIALAVLIRGEFIVENVPEISDIKKQLALFESLGGKFSLENNILKIDGTSIENSDLDHCVAKELRASVVYIGPLLARFKEVEFPFPGGCAIGRRPIDTHLNAFSELGAIVDHKEDSFKLTFDEFKSKNVVFSEPSVTATENLLMFLSYFDDEFTISNCAIEPEILALVDILNKAGANITNISERAFSIKGNSKLELEAVRMIPDRIEAFSYLVGFIITSSEGTIKNFPSKFMECPLKILKEIGAKFDISNDEIKVYKSPNLKPFSIVTAPYPDFPTDMQSPMSLIATIAEGESKINETMFENRLGYIEELKKMGLKANVLNKHEVTIEGPCKLSGSEIDALDLRSGITLVLAALAADGKSTINRGEIINRGYENLTEKLTLLGADVKRYD